jgi:hypothetical protein
MARNRVRRTQPGSDLRAGRDGPVRRRRLARRSRLLCRPRWRWPRRAGMVTAGREAPSAHAARRTTPMVSARSSRPSKPTNVTAATRSAITRPFQRCPGWGGYRRPTQRFSAAATPAYRADVTALVQAADLGGSRVVSSGALDANGSLRAARGCNGMRHQPRNDPVDDMKHCELPSQHLCASSPYPIQQAPSAGFAVLMSRLRVLR